MDQRGPSSAPEGARRVSEEKEKVSVADFWRSSTKTFESTTGVGDAFIIKPQTSNTSAKPPRTPQGQGGVARET
jgi:hypothetical protein